MTGTSGTGTGSARAAAGPDLAGDERRVAQLLFFGYLAARLRGRVTGRSGVNYLDLSRQLRSGGVFGRTIEGLVRRVRDAGAAPWVDGEAMWRSHRSGAADHGLALTYLASLGAHLR